MKALVCTFRQALHISNPPPWKPRSRIHHPTIAQNLSKSSKTGTSQAKVNAKGFANSPTTAKETTTSKLSSKNDVEDEIPEAVFNRVIVRVLAFVGVPLALGIALLKVFAAFKTQKLWDVPIWVPFFTTLLTFGASTMGIAYGALSTNLDPEKKGSLIGWNEAQKNWVEMWEEEEEDANR